MQLLYDILPILLFFIAYKLAGFYVATMVAIVASVVQVTAQWIWKRKLDRMQLITLVLILVFGGSTLLLHDPRFLQWKVTLLNWILALVFLGSHFIGKQCLIERFLAKKMPLPRRVFIKLNVLWALYFTVIGALNLYVMYTFDLDTWVNFKLFGVLGLSIVFLILQSLYLMRELKKHGLS